MTAKVQSLAQLLVNEEGWFHDLSLAALYPSQSQRSIKWITFWHGTWNIWQTQAKLAIYELSACAPDWCRPR